MQVDGGTERALAAAVREGHERQRAPLAGRELRAQALAGAMFLAGAIYVALNFEAERDWDPAAAVLGVLAIAAATRIQLDVGRGYAVPSQLVFVPMALLLPTPWVPLLVAAGWALGKLPDVLRGEAHPSRLLNVLGDSAFALGGVAVLLVADAQTPEWGQWGAYVTALWVQIAADALSAITRERLAEGPQASIDPGDLVYVYLIDVLLSPIALLVAFAADGRLWAAALMLPTLGLFELFARERARGMSAAAALGEREREAAELSAKLLEAERASTRDRENVVAGASAAMLTPLGTLTHLVHRLRASPTAHQSETHDALLRETQLLRHLVGQFIDYARVKAGRDLVVERRAFDLRPVVTDVVAAFPPEDGISLALPAELPPVLADPGRVGQIVFSLISNAVKFSPEGAPVTVKGHVEGAAVELSVIDHGPGIPARERDRIFTELRRGSASSGTEGAGLGLYLSRLLSEAQGATLTLESEPGAGTRFILTLPRAAGRLPRDTRPRRRLGSAR